MSAYPRMLYRPGKQCRVWNAHDVDTCTVADEDEHLKALDEGWNERPDAEPAKGRSKAPKPAAVA